VLVGVALTTSVLAHTGKTGTAGGTKSNHLALYGFIDFQRNKEEL
jgi:hypothetical protein